MLPLPPTWLLKLVPMNRYPDSYYLLDSQKDKLAHSKVKRKVLISMPLRHIGDAVLGPYLHDHWHMKVWRDQHHAWSLLFLHLLKALGEGAPPSRLEPATLPWEVECTEHYATRAHLINTLKITTESNQTSENKTIKRKNKTSTVNKKMAYRGVDPDRGFLEALNVTNAVIIEKIVQKTQKRHQANLTLMTTGISHIPSKVAF